MKRRKRRLVIHLPWYRSHHVLSLWLTYARGRAEEERRRTWGEVDLTDGQLEDAAANKHGVDDPNQSIQPCESWELLRG